jgi:hypothetical protein
MNTNRPEGEGKGPRRSATTAVLVTVAILLLLAASLVSISAQGATTSPAGATQSGLTPAGDITVDFVETGLATGTTWSVELNGTLSSSDTNTISFSEKPGTYEFEVTPVSGYTASPSSGSVMVSPCSSAVTVQITFTPVSVANYTVFFNETGLATGSTWWVDFDGTNTSATVPSINFSVPNGEYTFTDAAVVSGAPGVQFITSVTGGSVNVDGTNVSVPIPYSTQYFLTMIAYPSAGGTVTPTSGWYAAGASVDLTAAPATGYDFLNWTGSGTGNYTGTSAAPTITMNGPITENATFGYQYAVTFQESGLPDGVSWSVTFDGTTLSGYLVFLDFSAPNGTYSYSVAPIPGYHADSYAGPVTVKGSDVTVQITWVRVTYNVAFEESGLPSGTSWSVTLNGTSKTVTAPTTITFVSSNGTLPWTVAPVPGYTPNVAGASVTVKGANVEVTITWTAIAQPVTKTYTITFVEKGLPGGTDWSIHLNNTTSVSIRSTTSSGAFTGVSAGSYGYWVPDVGLYAPANSTGKVVVTNANVTVDVTFTELGPVPSTHPSTGISIWSLVIIAFIVLAAVLVSYVVFRRRT